MQRFNAMPPQISAISLARLDQCWVQSMHMATACPALCLQASVVEASPQTILWHSRHWVQQVGTLPHSPRTIEKLKPRFVFHLRRTIWKKITYLSKHKRTWITLSRFLFQNCRMILYTCLHLGIIFSHLIWKEMIEMDSFRERKNPCLWNWLQEWSCISF